MITSLFLLLIKKYCPLPSFWWWLHCLSPNCCNEQLFLKITSFQNPDLFYVSIQLRMDNLFHRQKVRFPAAACWLLQFLGQVSDASLSHAHSHSMGWSLTLLPSAQESLEGAEYLNAPNETLRLFLTYQEYTETMGQLLARFLLWFYYWRNPTFLLKHAGESLVMLLFLR